MQLLGAHNFFSGSTIDFFFLTSLYYILEVSITYRNGININIGFSIITTHDERITIVLLVSIIHCWILCRWAMFYIILHEAKSLVGLLLILKIKGYTTYEFLEN